MTGVAPRAAVAPPADVALAPTPPDRRSCRSERTSHQLLPAMISAPARMTALKAATCEFRTSLSAPVKT